MAVVRADDGVALHVEHDLVSDGDADAAVAGPTVVFTHGVTGASSTWGRLRAALRGRASVVVWDQRGHGRSGGGAPEHATIEQTGRDLGAVLDVEAPAGPLVLVGHSLGGMSILALAEQRPRWFADRVVGVLLLATPAGELRWDRGPGTAITLARRVGLLSGALAGIRAAAPLLDVLPWRSGAPGRWLSRYLFGDDDSVARTVHEQFLQLRITIAAAFCATVLTCECPAAWPGLPGVAVSVVVGHEDQVIPAGHGRRIRDVLAGDTELVVVPHAGHTILQTHPDEVDSALRRLLARCRVSQGTNPPARRATAS